ncbi:DUF898 family protein [Tistrella bauzanensis]
MDQPALAVTALAVTALAPTAPEPAAPEPARWVRFHGRRPTFRRLVMRGALLELLTAGFYRFWLATDIRRHLWSHTLIDGDPLEYVGRARELLIGFLVATAILVPVYLAYFLIGLEATRLQAFAGLPLVLVLYVFAGFAAYRSRRYRVTRTVWRGLRASMTGSGIGYALRMVAWDLLVVISLGLALPWRQAALERYKMRHTAYGTLAGAFDGTGGALFRRGWPLWLLAIPGVLLIIPIPFLVAAFRAILWQWWVSNIRFGAVRFHSYLDRDSLFGCYWKATGWAVLLAVMMGLWLGGVLGIAAALATAPVPGGTPDYAMAFQHPLVVAGIAIGYLLMVLGLGW